MSKSNPAVANRIAVVSEAVAARVISIDDAIAATERAFLEFATGQSLLFPAGRGHGSQPNTRFGMKPGYYAGANTPGVKVGSYWPSNREKGIGNHGSTTLLLDDATGLPSALIGATHLTALRTAASDAIAVKYLSRPDAAVLALLGTGHQAFHDAVAIARVRNLQRVLVVGRNAAGAEALAERLRAAGLPAEVSERREALAAADLVSTVTASTEALFDASEIRLGTHISAMGSDGPGKQELPVELTATARLFADSPAQSVMIGDFQHGVAAGRFGVDAITGIGDVIRGAAAGRTGAGEITVYDSSGIALQDLAICCLALERAEAQGLAVTVEL